MNVMSVNATYDANTILWRLYCGGLNPHCIGSCVKLSGFHQVMQIDVLTRHVQFLNPLLHGLINNPSQIRIRSRYNPNGSGSNPDHFHIEHV